MGRTCHADDPQFFHIAMRVNPSRCECLPLGSGILATEPPGVVRKTSEALPRSVPLGLVAEVNHVEKPPDPLPASASVDTNTGD